MNCCFIKNPLFYYLPVLLKKTDRSIEITDLSVHNHKSTIIYFNSIMGRLTSLNRGLCVCKDNNIFSNIFNLKLITILDIFYIFAQNFTSMTKKLVYQNFENHLMDFDEVVTFVKERFLVLAKQGFNLEQIDTIIFEDKNFKDNFICIEDFNTIRKSFFMERWINPKRKIS